MTNETLLDLIAKHNAAVTFFSTLDDVVIPLTALLRMMPLADKQTALGRALTKEAREMGIDAKCNMQSGEITVYGDIVAGE